mgnify:CR=1 FL=1
MATSRGWYDVGGGWAGMWDGERWTGERISHEQLAELQRQGFHRARRSLATGAVILERERDAAREAEDRTEERSSIL